MDRRQQADVELEEQRTRRKVTGHQIRNIKDAAGGMEYLDCLLFQNKVNGSLSTSNVHVCDISSRIHIYVFFARHSDFLHVVSGWN